MGKSSKRTLEEATAAAPASDAPTAGDVSMAVDTPSKPKKSKKDKKDKADAAGDDAEDDLSQVCEIAKPLAVKKTGKHVLKLVKKGEREI